MVSLIWVWINGWVNNDEAGDVIRRRAHYDVIIMNPNLTTECEAVQSATTGIIHIKYSSAPINFNINVDKELQAK